MSDEFDAWADCLPVFGTSGPEILTDCPWCDRPKMYVNRKKGLFFCQRCLERGLAKKLVAKVDGLTQEEAERRLAGRPGDSRSLKGQLALVTRGEWKEEEQYTNHPLPDEFVPCFNGLEWKIPAYVEELLSKR